MSRRDSAPPRATLTDVAREAGVHPSTASRALNPGTRGMVTEEVAARVGEVAERLGWRRSALAAGLRTRRSRIVGILVPDLVNPIFPPILRAAEARLAAEGYATLVANTDNDPERERMLVARMAEHLVDGLMLASAAEGSEAVALCRRYAIPAVLVNRRLRGAGLSSVTNDDGHGIALAVAHLVGLGHRRIAHLAGPVGVSTAADRRAGFRAALARAGLDGGAAPVAAAETYSREAGRLACARLLDAGEVTAIVAANDMLALGVYEEAERRGIAVGRGLSVTGFNDMPFVDRMAPPLTTVRIQHAAMGAEAASLLLAAMAAPDARRSSLRLRAELVVRGSTGPT